MDPLTWTYLALLAASTAASAKGQHDIQKDRAHVQAEDSRRRKQQQQEAEAAAMNTQDAYFNQRDKTASREAELAQQFQASPAPAPITDESGTRFLSTSAPTQSTRTIQASQEESAAGRARASGRATRMAQLGAFGDVLRESNLTAGRNAQDIGLSASKMQGWTQNVLPALYAKANTAGKDWQGFADIAKLAAAVMSFSALGGAGTGAGAGGGAESTTGVLDQMGGLPSEFAGQDLFGMGAKFGSGATGFAGASAAGLGGATELGNAGLQGASMFTGGYEDALLKYLNDPNLWKQQMPQYWNFYK
jgi:hypothetical protein